MTRCPDWGLWMLGNGPRSFTRTMIERPFSRLVTMTFVGKGRCLWAAERPLGLKASPLAVMCPPFCVRVSSPYQEAVPTSSYALASATDMGKYLLPLTVYGAFFTR